MHKLNLINTARGINEALSTLQLRLDNISYALQNRQEMEVSQVHWKLLEAERKVLREAIASLNQTTEILDTL